LLAPLTATENTDGDDASKTSCEGTLNTTPETQPNKSTATTPAGILETVETEEIIEFERLGPGLLDGISFTADVNWSLSAIPFLDRSRDWFIDEASTSGSHSSPSSFLSKRPRETPLLDVCEMDVCSTRHDIATVCILGSRFAFDGSFSRRCACVVASNICPTINPISASGGATRSVSLPTPTDA
jgi:hypothetical protein